MNYSNTTEYIRRKSGAGFTLIELAVVIAIIAILYGIILFSVTQYMNKSKDSNISANLAVLIPAGEVFYNGNNNSYQNFCSSNVVSNVKAQMPVNPSSNCYNSSTNPKGVCCYVPSTNYYQAWAACAREFADSSKAYCVDSRGIKKEILNSSCTNAIASCN